MRAGNEGNGMGSNDSKNINMKWYIMKNEKGLSYIWGK